MPTDDDGTAGSSRAPRLLSVVGVVAVVAVAVGAWILWPRGTTEITTEDAVSGFRDSGAETTGIATSERTTPEPGVYEYTASGSEQVKFGPLPTEDRPVPDTVTVVISEATEGPEGLSCFEWTLNLFEQHTEDTTWCTDGQGTLTLAGHTKHQSIGALSPALSLDCDPDTILEVDSEESEISCAMTLSGGPAQLDAELDATATTGATEAVQVGDETVEATPLSIDYEVSGSLSGSWVESFRLGQDLLPLRIERELDLAGPATLTESSTLELTSTTPAR